MDIGDCRVAFATEKIPYSALSSIESNSKMVFVHIFICCCPSAQTQDRYDESVNPKTLSVDNLSNKLSVHPLALTMQEQEGRVRPRGSY